jgi:hypothetical protein
MKRAAFAFGLSVTLFRAGGAFAGGAPCGSGGSIGSDGGDASAEAGSCLANEYCALPDGGAILDGAAGVCQLEPCVLSSDCTDPNRPICDTSQNPFACVECISGADCMGSLVCDTANHTCVNAPDASAPDASTGDASALDGGPDAGEPDAADGAVNAAMDAGKKGDGAVPVVVPPPPEDGSLAGGAWDCGLATEGGSSRAAIAAPFVLVVALFGLRRFRKRAR